MVRRWLRQLTRDYSQWVSASAWLWDENVVTALYMRRTHHQASHQATVHDHRRRVRLLYGSESHRIGRGSEELLRKHRRKDYTLRERRSAVQRRPRRLVPPCTPQGATVATAAGTPDNKTRPNSQPAA